MKLAQQRGGGYDLLQYRFVPLFQMMTLVTCPSLKSYPALRWYLIMLQLSLKK